MSYKPHSVEQTYDAPIAKVWDALTTNDQIKQWFFDTKEFKPEVGFKFSFVGGPEHWAHLCEVTAADYQKKLAYTWRFEGMPGDSVVTFELFAEGDKTRLKLTHEGIESFGKHGEDFSAESFMEGWTGLLGLSLKNFVDKN